jgi:Eukaryotic aspartyl protease
VDTDKYTGTLGIVNVQETAETQEFDTFTVVLSDLSFSVGGSTSNIDLKGTLPVILDSGTTLTYLPDDIAHEIYNGLGIEYDDIDGPFVPCNVKTDNMKFTFTFGSDKGVAIDVDLGQFVLPYDPQAMLPDINGGQACTFGLFPAGTVSNGQGDILFGDTFLRSAYVVYDLDNNQVAMAQTKFGTSDSNVKAINGDASASTNTIPGATTVQDQVSANQAANPTDIGAVPTGFPGAETTGGGGNAHPTSAQATFNGISGGLATGSTVPATPGASSKSAASSLRVPKFEWESVAVAGVAAVGALMGGGWFVS